mmetsp:Transcript_25570/g.52481  ORF Transcript_25570/g.52481 Transcript_25570/m.52481 type:complete len:926 (+) Transcript_25570:132-2909(+)
MECVAGIAAAGGLTTKAAFDYNRDNFLYDRYLRMRKEFNVLGFRIDQAALWREDVRDLISLTEYKMHIYLLVNVIMLGFTVVLWCEGRLPSHTPSWLLMGNAIGITGAFCFLMLSMWLAMHAAVTAQSFEARLLTTMVRLPIPSWEEVEACRTYSSEFERTDPKQMLRVPFVMGQQENINSLGGSGQASDSDAGSLRPGTLNATDDAESEAVDPWGFERSGDDIVELGCPKSSAVADLRHIKLARQAMGYWQSYDAFARISLSLGVNALILALTYYLLGYVSVQAGVKTAACFGVAVLTILSHTTAQLDMSLSRYQWWLLVTFLNAGPTLACIATFHWTAPDKSNAFSSFIGANLAELLITIAFLSHGLQLALMLKLSQVQEQSMLPTAFRSVLYCDVFGWMTTERFVKRASQSVLPSALRAARCTIDQEDDEVSKPALGAIRYEAGMPLPMRPEDMKPAGSVQDCRALPGAPVVPSGHCTIPRKSDTAFFKAASWVPPKPNSAEDDFDTMLGGSPISSGHESNPRAVPVRVFAVITAAVCCAWLLASLTHLLELTGIWKGVFSLRMRYESAEGKEIEMSKDVFDRMAVFHAESPSQGISMPYKRATSMIQRDKRINFEKYTGLFLNDFEPVSAVWPHANVLPSSLACDAAGRHLAVTDGFLLLSAELKDVRAEQQPRSWWQAPNATMAGVFKEAPCAALVGEGLQDLSVACHGATCEALVLHRRGRRVATCPLAGPAGLTAGPATVSDTWLERQRDGTSEEDEATPCDAGPHRCIEKAVAIAQDPACADGAATGQACAVLATTHGRVVRLRQRRGGSKELVPAEVLRESGAGREAQGAPLLTGPGAVRPLRDQYFGLLEGGRGGQSLLVLDGANGGAQVARLRLPASRPAAGFCAGGGSIIFLGVGPSPMIWRTPLPSELVAAA